MAGWTLANTLANNKADVTGTPSDHASHHNALADAINGAAAALSVTSSSQFGKLAIGAALLAGANIFSVLDTTTLTGLAGGNQFSSIIDSKITVTQDDLNANSTIIGHQTTQEAQLNGNFSGTVIGHQLVGAVVTGAGTTLANSYGYSSHYDVLLGAGARVTRHSNRFHTGTISGTAEEVSGLTVECATLFGTITRAVGHAASATIQGAQNIGFLAEALGGINGGRGFSFVGGTEVSGGGLPPVMSHTGHVGLGATNPTAVVGILMNQRPVAPFVQLHLNETVSLTTNRTASADGITVNGSNIVSSANAAFTLSDLGKTITGTNIPANTVILGVSQKRTTYSNPAGFFQALADGATTASGTTITTDQLAFGPQDVGRQITDAQAAIPAGTTIASVTNSKTAVLSAAATATTSANVFTIPSSAVLSANATGTGNSIAFTLAAGNAVGYSSTVRSQPVYTGAQTVARHAYWDVNTPSLLASAAVTDAVVARFDAAAGTHKAVDGATTKTTPGGVDAWVKIDVNGAVRYIPAYVSKTA